MIDPVVDKFSSKLIDCKICLSHDHTDISQNWTELNGSELN